jgi:RpiR family transcriptional regulator, carbohydrate utilization regulator
MENNRNCLLIIRSAYPSLHETEARIADLITEKPEAVIHMTVAQLAKEIGVADSSVIRFCQKMGFNGFTQLKINLAQHLKNPEAIILNDLKSEDDSYTIVSKVFASSINALNDTLKMVDKNELLNAISALLSAKRIEFYGVGTSVPLAVDAYYRFMRIGLPAYAATDPHISKISANMLDKDCVAFGISHTGRTVDTIKAIEIARNKGAKTICITSYINSPITEIADIKLVTSTNESKFMKEAVSSRLAQIALLDGLYSCVALKKYNSTLENLENMTEILNEMRY